jgi:hypothetical protein
MLHERHVRLLTAYVDGELSPAQRRQAARLLRRSEEARALLRQLQGDSRELQALPPVVTPIDFSGPVLAAIGQSRPRPAPRPRPVRAGLTFPVWTGWAAAAAVLLVVGMGSFLSYYSRPVPSRQGQTASEQASVPHDKDRGEQPTPRKEVVKETGSSRKVEDRTPSYQPVDRSQAARQDPDPKVDTLPPPLEPDDDRSEGTVLTSPGRDGLRQTQLERIELALPVIHQLHALDQPENARRLSAQIGAAPAFRIELLARDASRGLARVRAAAARLKLALVIDPTAQARLKKPRWRTDFALFAENITPAEMVALLRAIGKADRPGGDKKSAERRFDGALVVKELSPWDRKELTDLLGVDPVRVRPGPAKKQAALDITRPLSEQTREDVAAALAGKRAPRPGTNQPERSVLVLPLGGSRIKSPELRRFLDQRRPAQTGTVQVFLVLRNLPH